MEFSGTTGDEKCGRILTKSPQPRDQDLSQWHSLTSNILIDTSQGAQPTLIGAAAEIDDRGRNMDMSSAG
jgi:hypothetical protein